MSVIGMQLRCAVCGGDLRGCEVFGLCAECHRPVSETIRVEALDTATLAVCEDVPCVRCGYNLRTLSLEAKCPECARNVVDSLARNELHLADVKWLKRIRLGLGILLVGVLLEFLQMLGANLIGFLAAFTNGAFPGPKTSWKWVTLLVVSFIANILVPLGILNIASRNPAREFNLRLNNAAKILALIMTFTWLLGVAHLWPIIRSGSLGMILLDSVVSMAYPACLVCTACSLKRFALLGRNRSLAMSCRFVMVCVTANVVLLIVQEIWVYNGTQLLLSASWIRAFQVYSFLMIIAYLLASASGIIMLVRFRRFISSMLVEREPRTTA